MGGGVTELLAVTLAHSAKKTEVTGRWRLNCFKAVLCCPINGPHLCSLC